MMLLFRKNRLYLIAKEMRALIGMSFLFPYISSFLSSFSTVLMRLSNSSKLYACARNRCLSSLQWCSKSFDVVQIRFILIAYFMESYLLMISDVLDLHEGSSADRFVFHIFWCKVCCSWYTPLYPVTNTGFWNFVLKFNWVGFSV